MEPLKISGYKSMKLSHKTSSIRGQSCDDYSMGVLMGCCKVTDGLEHSILCAHFASQTPERMRAAAKFCATQMLTGKEIFQRRIKKLACELMGISDDISDDDFEVQWVAFMIIERGRAADLPDYK